jgi:hypothetical protein
MSDGDEVEAIASSHLPPMNLFWELLPKCCDTHAPTHVTGPSCKLSNIPSRRSMMVLPILVGTSGNVAPRTHIKSHEVRLVWLRLLRQCERFVRVALYRQINWISLAVVGACTALFMVGAILAYDPARGFLARRGEPGGGT